MFSLPPKHIYTYINIERVHATNTHTHTHTHTHMPYTHAAQYQKSSFVLKPFELLMLAPLHYGQV